MSLFDHPLLLGFDQFEQVLDRMSRTGSESYPPYNIEQIDANLLRITVAVAGFVMDDLSVQIEQNQLVIRGKRQNVQEEDHVFLHRGIAMRQFQKSFLLSDDIEVLGASLDNGLLNVDLKRIVTEIMVQTISISQGDDDKAEHEKIKRKTIDVETEASE